MTHDDLSTLRGNLAGCELAALVDVATGTPLMCASIVETTQELLDTLARQAVILLTGSGTYPETFCLLAHPTGSRAFVRGSADSADALCLIFAPTASLENIEGSTAAFFRKSFVSNADD